MESIEGFSKAFADSRKYRCSVGGRSTRFCHTGKKAEGISHVTCLDGGADTADRMADGTGPQEPSGACCFTPVACLFQSPPVVLSHLSSFFIHFFCLFPAAQCTLTAPPAPVPSRRNCCAADALRASLIRHCSSTPSLVPRKCRVCVCTGRVGGGTRIVELGMGSESPFSHTELLFGPGQVSSHPFALCFLLHLRCVMLTSFLAHLDAFYDYVCACQVVLRELCYTLLSCRY